MASLKWKTAVGGLTARSRFTFAFASLATTLAGYFDAVGYSHLNHLYVSFMSGNSTHFGMALAAGGWGEAASAGNLIGIFVVGTFVGTLILDIAFLPMVVILISEVLICGVALVLAAAGFVNIALTLTAVMMGMQNVLHQNIHDTDAGKGFITGALFGLGQSLARALRRSDELTQAGVYASTWMSFIIGVVCGAISIANGGVLVSLGIALSALVLLATMAAGMAAGGRD